MGKLIIFHGLPGSGKSTIAQNLVNDDPMNRVRLNRDDLRTAIAGESYHSGQPDKKVENQVTAVQQKLLKKYLSEGKTVYVDDTNLNPRRIMGLMNVAREHNAEISQIHVDTPVEECKRRNKLRGAAGGREVPEFVIDRMAKDGYGSDGHIKEFKIGLRTVFAYDRAGSKGEKLVNKFNEEADKKYGPLKGGTMNFDMDGTLADTRDVSNKYMSNNKRDFHNFHKSSEFVPANEDVLKLAMDAHNEGIPITVTTARADTYAKETINWLNNNGVPVRRLYMRHEGDFRADYEVKKEILEKAKNEGVFFAHCVDDNPQAIRAWQENGVRVTEIPFHKAVDPNTVTEEYKTISVESPLGSGVCIRCGQPIKKGSIGPKCATKI
mgnify:CR=1 FL=1